jgi:hypothetical protein
MLTEKTLDQLIGVLELTEKNYRTGLPVSKAYQKAVKDIASRYSVRYQTIADGCSRRLNLDTVEVFIGLLSQWLSGNGNQLKALLIKNISELDEYKVENFFDHNRPSTQPTTTSTTQSPPTSRKVEETTDVITLKISRNLVGQLRALSEAENKNIPDFIINIIKEYLDIHYVEFVRNLINSLPQDRREKILKDMANQLK